jgi:hypothetical protein
VRLQRFVSALRDCEKLNVLLDAVQCYVDGNYCRMLELEAAFPSESMQQQNAFELLRSHANKIE